MTWDEAALLDGIKRRDTKALTSLFECINPALLKMLSSRGVYGEVSKDILNATWETFFEHIASFQGRSQIKTFVLGILINKIREHRRADARIDLEEDAEKIFSKHFTDDGWWSKEPSDPQSLLENKELGQHIQQCLDGLTDPQKSAFILIEVNREKAEEACNILGVTFSHLRVLIFRAKDKLRSCLSGKIAAH